MKVSELKEILSHYPDDAHVVVAIVPDEQTLVPKQGQKWEVEEGWCDHYGVVNLITTTPCDAIAANLRSENNLD